MLLSSSNRHLFILCALQQQIFSIKGQIAKVWGLWATWLLTGTTQLCLCHVEAARDNTQMNDWDCVSIKLDSRTLKFEFHIIFTCHKKLFFFQFPLIIKNVKIILSSFLAQGMSWIWSMGWRTLLLSVLWYSMLETNPNEFIYSPVDGHWADFPAGTITHGASINYTWCHQHFQCTPPPRINTKPFYPSPPLSAH